MGADLRRPRQRRAADVRRRSPSTRPRRGRSRRSSAPSSRPTRCWRRSGCPRASRSRSTTPCTSSTSPTGTLVGRVPTFAVQVKGIWTAVLGLPRRPSPAGASRPATGRRSRSRRSTSACAPQYRRSRPGAGRRRATGLTQRVPFDARGSYDGCPVRGFGWSELIINWYGHEEPRPVVHRRQAAEGAQALRRPEDQPPTGRTGPLTPGVRRAAAAEPRDREVRRRAALPADVRVRGQERGRPLRLPASRAAGRSRSRGPGCASRSWSRARRPRDLRLRHGQARRPRAS